MQLVFANFDRHTFTLFLKASLSNPYASQRTDHAVTVIGYGTDVLNRSYWLAKNSWGKDRPGMGFFKIKRGTGHCGIGDYQLMPLCSAN